MAARAERWGGSHEQATGFAHLTVAARGEGGVGADDGRRRLTAAREEQRGRGGGFAQLTVAGR
jgi:hypothetical protein